MSFPIDFPKNTVSIVIRNVDPKDYYDYLKYINDVYPLMPLYEEKLSISYVPEMALIQFFWNDKHRPASNFGNLALNEGRGADVIVNYFAETEHYFRKRFRERDIIFEFSEHETTPETKQAAEAIEPFITGGMADEPRSWTEALSSVDLDEMDKERGLTKQ